MAANTNDFRATLPRVRRALLAWYGRSGRRELPWRTIRDPYAIYLSEIMLQQTQAKTVLERYYLPFLKRFPSLQAVAQAEVEAVVKQWEGLGYYTRARNLHAASRACQGLLPEVPEALMALPGIGRNTANAVACFAYGAPVPVMEANVKRVLCRIFALKTPDEATLWRKAYLLLDSKNAFDYNQAMMDVGALLCTKRNPRCGECPLASICKGKSAPERYPQAKKAKAIRVRERIIVAFHDDDGRYFLTRRETRFLGGLYGFMEYESEMAQVKFGDRLYALKKAMLLGQLTQTYSHFRLQAKVYCVALTTRLPDSQGWIKASCAEMKHLPLSRADHKVMRMLQLQEAEKRQSRERPRPAA